MKHAERGEGGEGRDKGTGKRKTEHDTHTGGKEGETRKRFKRVGKIERGGATQTRKEGRREQSAMRFAGDASRQIRKGAEKGADGGLRSGRGEEGAGMRGGDENGIRERGIAVREEGRRRRLQSQ